MNDAVTDLGDTTSMLPMKSLIIGKVTEVAPWKENFYTTVVTPSPDQYSSPGRVSIRSKRTWAKTGQEVEVEVLIGGYTSQIEKEDGSKIYIVNNTLDLLE